MRDGGSARPAPLRSLGYDSALARLEAEIVRLHANSSLEVDDLAPAFGALADAFDALAVHAHDVASRRDVGLDAAVELAEASTALRSFGGAPRLPLVYAPPAELNIGGNERVTGALEPAAEALLRLGEGPFDQVPAVSRFAAAASDELDIMNDPFATRQGQLIVVRILDAMHAALVELRAARPAAAPNGQSLR